MRSFLQYGSRARLGPAARPLLMGALTCGVLLVGAPAASAGHTESTMGTMCPHAAGLPVAGEAPAVAPPVRTAGTAPITTPQAAPAQPARPAAKPAAQAPSKAGSQAQAQRPATSQAQAQRPAAAQAQAQRPAVAQAPAQRQVALSKPDGRTVTAPTPTKAGAVTTAPRQVAGAGTTRAGQSRRESTTTAPRALSRPLDVVAAKTGPALVQDETLTERPTAGNVGVAQSGDSGLSETAMILLGLLVVSTIGAVGVVAARLRKRGAARTAPLPTLAEAREAAIEAELHAMIAQARTGVKQAPDQLGVAGDDCELSRR